MKKNPVEALLGFFVLIFCGFFLVFSANKIDLKKIEGYQLRASFAQIGGLEMGADVRVNGIKVVSVTKITLDPETFMVNLEMNIQNNVLLPIDTTITIADSGLMGNKYVRLNPGQQKQRISRNGTITRVKEYRSLEDNVSEFIFLSTKEDKK